MTQMPDQQRRSVTAAWVPARWTSFSSQEIAAAVGQIPSGIGREVMLTCHPLGDVPANPRRLAALFNHLVLTEWRKRQHRLIDAKIELGIADSRRRWRQSIIAEQWSALVHLQKQLDHARSMAWPETVPHLLTELREAILEEIRHSQPCLHCHLWVKQPPARGKSCIYCKGAGQIVHSERWRARMLGKDPSNYRRDWRDCYTWILWHVKQANQSAYETLLAALPQHAH